MESGRQELCEQLETVDTSLGFLLLIILSVVLSYIATARQREALCLTLQGDLEKAEKVGEVYPLRLGASALIVGALGYFFELAQETCAAADPDDPAGRGSAARNLLAGFLVLAAALIRLFDLNLTRQDRSGQADGLPDG